MLRKDFPLMSNPPYLPFCYADNAATTHMPQVVIDAMSHYAYKSHANVHRSPYRLAESATAQYELLRELLAQRYIIEKEGVVITHGATEGLNLLASVLSQTLKEGDGVLLSYLDHHSMIVPWQFAANQKSLEIYWAPLTPEGTIDCVEVERLIAHHPNIRIMSIMAVSNVLGTYQPIKELTDIARDHNIVSIVDGCQMALDIVSLKDFHCDFWVLGAHKMFGPTGIGAVLAREPKWWDTLNQYQSGGGMISMVSSTHTLVQEGYARFEAGTPPIQAASGWAAALQYIQTAGSLETRKHYNDLVAYALEQFGLIKGYKLFFKQNAYRAGIFSFTHQSIHPHDLATYLDHMYGIAARAGHHCAMPLMTYLGIDATLRLSLTWYNTREDVDHCVKALTAATEFFNV
jgi:cysteine desulfurase/selenocysteine lyase